MGYVRNLEYTNSADGSATDGRGQTLLVCNEWAESKIGDGTRFDECGLLKSSPCIDGDGNPIGDRDPYVCGDDIIIPTRDYYDDSRSLVENIEAFLNADELGTPNMAGDYGYYVVNNAPCTDAEFEANPNPRCLMTVDQLNRYDTVHGVSIKDATGGSYTSDEMCFNAATTATLVPFLALVPALLAFLVL